MKWSTLKFLSKKFIRISLNFVAFIPIISSVLNLNILHRFFLKINEQYYFVFIGSVLYIIASFFISKLAPEIVFKMDDRESYIQSIKTNLLNINPEYEFSYIIDADENYIQKMFPQFSVFIPIKNGIHYFTAEKWSFPFGYMNYELANRSNRFIRMFLSLFVLTGILLMYFKWVIRGFDYLVKK